MNLTAIQAYEVEQALKNGNTIEAVKRYREATGCGLAEAKKEVDKLTAELRKQKPWYFKNQPTATSVQGPRQFKISPMAIAIFLLVDFLIFAAIIYFFIFWERDGVDRENREQARQQGISVESAQGPGRPKSIALPEQVNAESYSSDLTSDETFASLYRQKIDSSDYIARKRYSGRSYDDSELERKLKTARSVLAAGREAPEGVSVTTINESAKQPNLDGIIGDGEWQDATRTVIDKDLQTTIYLKTDGEWLFFACDVPGELTSGGYDQFRVYFHAGLVDGLVNERIHIGRGAGVTAIRQTEFKWLGKPPTTDDERWKKYAISDWGLYRYSFGTSSMHVGHRQYEAAVHLREAGLHAGVPFTLFAEIETDPLKNSAGKFVERQYLGELGNQENPHWMMF